MDITSNEFVSRCKDGSLIIIDVREEFEFQTSNIGGTNIPLGMLIKDIEELTYGKEEEIVLICQHGLRSETARKVMSKYGYLNVRNLTGGIVGVRRTEFKLIN